MSKLTEFYTMKSHLFTEGLGDEAKWNEFEDKLIREELLPEIMSLIKPTLSQVKSPLSINISYDPNGNLAVTATRNCIQASLPVGLEHHIYNKVEEENVETVAESEETETAEETDVKEVLEDSQPKFTKKKSVGFSVTFKDGTVIHERKAVKTWIAALKKIGLDNIINNQRKHDAWHTVDGKNICIVDRVETVRSSDNKSPQTLVDGYYVMTQLSNEQKVKDLESLAEFMPKLGIKVTWDSEEEPSATDDATPTVAPMHARTSNLTEEELADTSIRGEFRRFMCQNVERQTANNYIYVLDNHVKPFILNEVDASANDSIFSFETIEEVGMCIDLLKSNTAFMYENAHKHNSMTAAMGQYLKFIKTK